MKKPITKKNTRKPYVIVRTFSDGYGYGSGYGSGDGSGYG